MIKQRKSILLLLLITVTIAISCKRKDFYKESTESLNNTGQEPTITLNGADSIGIPLWDTLTDPGATAVDANGNPLVVLKQTNINLNLAGDYYIKYTATDQYGNQAAITRKVSVIITSQHYLGNWDVDHNCRTTTFINLIKNNALVTSFANYLTIEHEDRVISAICNGQDITVTPSIISLQVINIYEFTGSGRMADDGSSFTVNYSYSGIGGLAGNGNCTATYRRI